MENNKLFERRDREEETALNHGLVAYLAGDEWCWEADIGHGGGFDTEGEAWQAGLDACEA